MTRQEVYQIIKNNPCLKEEISKAFGINYTNVPTKSLEKFISNYKVNVKCNKNKNVSDKVKYDVKLRTVLFDIINKELFTEKEIRKAISEVANLVKDNDKFKLYVYEDENLEDFIKWLKED